MPSQLTYTDLYAMLNDAEIAYLYRSDPKVPVRAIKTDDPAPYSDPLLLERHRHQIVSSYRRYHGRGGIRVYRQH